MSGAWKEWGNRQGPRNIERLRAEDPEIGAAVEEITAALTHQGA